MKSLIVEDDFTSRLYLQEVLKQFGPAHIAVNGREAIDAAQGARDAREPYDLICMDIMMPQMDGQEALERIREDEKRRDVTSSHGTKVIMTTALDNVQNVSDAFHNLCDAYLVKPIEKEKLLYELRQLGLINENGNRD